MSQQPFSVDAKDIILAESIFVDFIFGTNFFISAEPDEPDTCITIYDTTGLDDDSQIDPIGYTWTQHPAIQIRVRDNSYEEAYQTAKSIVDLLNIVPEEVNGSCYQSITKVGTIRSLGEDDRKRTRLVINFLSTREES